MERFLSRCAEYIYNRHYGNLKDVCLIFPNRRSGVFFNAYLQKQLTKPAIGPHITTVNEFISSFTTLHQAEKLILISELYTIFKKHTHSTETFDEFYFWGEVLLSDFNDIDHYLASAKDLFTNVSDLKEIEQLFDYLTDAQREVIALFWGNLAKSGKKAHQEKFLLTWQKLWPIYNDFRQQLQKKGLAYTGMIYRQVVEDSKSQVPDLKFKAYYVIGLNALNACEKAIFKAMDKQAVFLWDYDDMYVNDPEHESGAFLRHNLKTFPAPSDFKLNTSNYSLKKNFRIVAVPSIYGQAQEIPRFLKQHSNEFKNEFDNCAIILADESMLFPVLGAIPDEIEAINVTMGYPVKNSVVYGFLLLLMNLLKNRRVNNEGKEVVYHRFVTDVLNHQLMANVSDESCRKYLDDIKKYNRISIPLDEIDFSPLHKLVFNLPDKVTNYGRYFLNILGNFYKLSNELEPDNKLLPELIYSLYQTIEKLDNVIKELYEEQGLEINNQIYLRLFHQYAGMASVTFEGEPVHGMQVMGILETRCLDFDNLVILGLNENKWPRNFIAPSFIPYNIRKGFGLPGIEEQDAMYAYYFYRLTQRAKNITATYSTIKEGISSGELSRYGHQLIYDSDLEIEKSSLDFQFTSKSYLPVTVDSSLEKTSVLLDVNSSKRPLSPTAINMWLQCSLKFYYKYIMQLEEPDELKEEIDSPVFGSIFHETIENLYMPFVGKTVNKQQLEAIRNNKILIENEITKAIGKHYFKQEKPGKITLEGRSILIFENIKTFLQQLIDIDIQLTPFDLVMLEEKISEKILVPVNGEFREIHIGGVIDRVDRVNGKIRIIDYKTGNVDSLTFSDTHELFEKDKEKPKKEILQALIYCMVYKKKFPAEEKLQPAVYSLRRLFNDKFDPLIKWDKQEFSFEDIEQEFSEHLQELVMEIFSPAGKFSQTINEKNCSYCFYNKICQRY